MTDSSDPKGNPPRFLTTREVADLLRVKERKVYDLAAAGEISHRRITGKLLFPRAELMAWIEGTQSARPAVLAGSHDPLLDWAIRESGCALATLYDGSMDGFERFAKREAALAGMHIPEAEGWNLGTVEAAGLTQAVLIGWAGRSQGLIVRAGLEGEVRELEDLPGRRVSLRQPGAGGRALFEKLVTEAELGPDLLSGNAPQARTETEAAAAVATGEADVTLGLAAMARQFQLPFVPLVVERFDLLIDWASYFSDPVQKLLGFARSEAFVAKAEALGGYEIADLGAVRWHSS